MCPWEKLDMVACEQVGITKERKNGTSVGSKVIEKEACREVDA